MSKDFYTAVKERRTIYGLSKEPVTSDQRILEIIEQAVKHAPSAFNSQSGRAVLLLGEHHHRLWDITKNILAKIVPPEILEQTIQKLNGFRNGYGSILIFEDQKVITDLQANFPTYKDAFPIFSQNSSGMLQYILWTSLEVEGFGASLQHYNPLIDEEVKKEWNLPGHWKLVAEMPFGKPTAPAGEKEFQPLAERIKIFQ